MNKGNIRSKDSSNDNDELQGYSEIRTNGVRKGKHIINGKDFKNF